jgi:hypothetical protein
MGTINTRKEKKVIHTNAREATNTPGLMKEKIMLASEIRLQEIQEQLKALHKERRKLVKEICQTTPFQVGRTVRVLRTDQGAADMLGCKGTIARIHPYASGVGIIVEAYQDAQGKKVDDIGWFTTDELELL